MNATDLRAALLALADLWTVRNDYAPDSEQGIARRTMIGEVRAVANGDTDTMLALLQRARERNLSPISPISPAPVEVATDTHGPGKCLPVDGVEFDRAVASQEQDEREVWIRQDERTRCANVCDMEAQWKAPWTLEFQLLSKCADAVRALPLPPATKGV